MSLTFKTIARVCLILGLIVVLGQAQSDTFFSEWRPNADTRGLRYVGNKVCADCHPREAAQLTTPMAQALEVAPDCKILTARNRQPARAVAAGSSLLRREVPGVSPDDSEGNKN